MMLLVLFFSLLCSTTIATSLSYPGSRLPKERIVTSLDLVLATINDFYVPIYSFPEDGPYDADAWSVQTQNYSDAIDYATFTLEFLAPLDGELADHVADFVESYIYHDLAAALEEVRTRRFAFYEIGIHPSTVYATMNKWLAETTTFNEAVLLSATCNTEDELSKAFEDLGDAFNDVFEEYTRDFAPPNGQSWFEVLLKNLLLGSWLRIF